MATIRLPQDFKEFLQLLNAHQVEYLLIGGYAVGYHGYPRATADMEPLQGVPGSVEMFERCHFDPVQCRWIDEWQPTAAPDQALAQSVRCYTPADLLLLLEGTGLALTRIEVDGEAVDVAANRITRSGPLMEAWCYLVQLTQAERP